MLQAAGIPRDGESIAEGAVDMARRLANSVILAAALLLPAHQLTTADIDEFKIKRQEVFEFTEKPKVTRDATSQPDRFVIMFASKGNCDATVAIEDAQGKIVRHLASGVLEPDAPAPSSSLVYRP